MELISLVIHADLVGKCLMFYGEVSAVLCYCDFLAEIATFKAFKMLKLRELPRTPEAHVVPWTS